MPEVSGQLRSRYVDYHRNNILCVKGAYMFGIGLNDYQNIFKIPVFVSILAIIYSFLAYSILVLGDYSDIVSLGTIELIFFFTGYVTFLLLSFLVCVFIFNIFFREFIAMLYWKKHNKIINNGYRNIFELQKEALKTNDSLLYDYSSELIKKTKEIGNTSVIYFTSIFYQAFILLIVDINDLLFIVKNSTFITDSSFQTINIMFIVTFAFHLIGLFIIADPYENKYIKLD